MANTARPCGFKPYERALRESTYVAGGTVYPGDAVKLNSDGKVVVAAAGDALLGVACNYAAADGSEVKVWDDPDQKFEASADAGGSVSVAQSDVGLNADILATSASTAYKKSRHEIDISTKATTAAQLRLLAILPAVDNAAGERARVVCMINEHQLDTIDDTGV